MKKCENVRSRCIKCYWDGSKSAYIEASPNRKNPWEEIKLEDYEKHMSLDSVRQLQAMNKIMHEQFEAYPVKTAMVLGVAGGNGLEHVRSEKYQVVYGIDINEEYLAAASKRYEQSSEVLQFMKMDLLTEADRLPRADLIIANLIIANLIVEYIGYSAFKNAVRRVDPEYVSCVIQVNSDDKQWVSDSPYLHVFDGLDNIHHQMEESALASAMKEIAYKSVFRSEELLPNGKSLIRMDFRKETEEILQQGAAKFG
ncbi:class I SAM-dependent methyltransferase [Butyrivibrio sp. AE3009]|uniref:class I SAM-dependent methyltransferase n=1 Tax=Butyrivibrio sp. AE3009 TaxID=1280666 RepID=UPI0004256AF2|nr:class I SAM-dependent methyltransferase [Butyrivibrio sp. AE3009]